MKEGIKMKVIKYNDGNDNKYMTEDQKKKMNIYKYENTDNSINENSIDEKSDIEYFTE